MESVWQGLIEDFTDVPSVGEVLRIAVRMTLAAGLGGVLGYERMRARKSAGLRTHMLVGLGSAMFAMIPYQAGMKLEDMSRVVQGIVTGIGFIGAGSILKLSEEHEVRGLTTAAGIWLTSAIGMAAGMGREVTAILGTLFAYIVLASVHRFERKMFGEEATDSHQA